MVHRSGRLSGAAYLYCGPNDFVVAERCVPDPRLRTRIFGPHDEEKAQMADTHHNDHDHNSADHAASGSRIVEAPLFCVVPLWVTALGCVALFLYADRLYAMLEPIVK